MSYFYLDSCYVKLWHQSHCSCSKLHGKREQICVTTCTLAVRAGTEPTKACEFWLPGLCLLQNRAVHLFQDVHLELPDH